MASLVACVVAAALLASLPVPSAAAAPAVPALREFSTAYAGTHAAPGFLFDVRAKAPLVIYGLDVSLVHPGAVDARVVVYTRAGSHQGVDGDAAAWEVWLDARAASAGDDAATPVPQRAADAAAPLVLAARERRAFYVAAQEGAGLRYHAGEKLYYINRDLVVYGNGAAKRRGWDGDTIAPRTFNGGLHYYLGDAPAELPPGVGLLPGRVLSEPPTASPAPSASLAPTGSPTPRPTTPPTPRPTGPPTASPTGTATLSAALEDGATRPVLVYAGTMFDVKGRQDVEITALGLNTFRTDAFEVQLYTRAGTFRGAEDDLRAWTWVNNVTVAGQGMGTPSYLPPGSFPPVLVRRGETVGLYVTTDRPYFRLGRGEQEGKALLGNPDVVVYEGVGKRHPIDTGTIRPRTLQGVVGYRRVEVPTPSPTIDTRDLFVRNATFTPTADTYVQATAPDEVFGRKAQLMVDGSPERVALLHFDVAVLNGGTGDGPAQVLGATLRLYSMTESDFGGYVSVIPEGSLNKKEATWATSPYAAQRTGTPVGQFRGVWVNRFYELDLTSFLRESLPREFVVRISSDRDNGVMYRSRDGASDKGPRLEVRFAYDPDVSRPLARSFGSDPPTVAPTVKPTVPEWADALTPRDPPDSYFNYRPGSSYGPERWHRARGDGYYDRLKKLTTDMRRNRCRDGRRQSPRNLCQTDQECLEYHEARYRRGEYGLGHRNETTARPTPLIMHNKLRLSYKERFSEFEKPIPPGADFAQNGVNSGTQDLVHIDLKVRSEHRLCGKQYDAEMQLWYLHNYGNMEATAILINADGKEHNAHFQILLDYFQLKFNGDKAVCARRRRRAEALSVRQGGEAGDSPMRPGSKLRGSSTSLSSDAESEVNGGAAEHDTFAHSLTASSSEAAVEVSEMREDVIAGAEALDSSSGNVPRARQNRRRGKRELRWDPLKSWDVLKSVHFWAYSGSTTEPPCFEDVNWRVVDVPMTISMVQYYQLKRLMFDHVDPDTCRRTSTHYDESNARPVQPYRGGLQYRCRRSDYASDMERAASGRVKGFVMREKWWGVDNLPWVEPEFYNT